MSGVSIADFCDVEDGLTTCESYKLADVVKEKRLVQGRFFRLTSTAAVEPYRPLWGVKETTFFRKKYIEPVVSVRQLEQQMPSKYAQSLSAKIIVCGTGHFRGFLDRDGVYVAGQNTVILTGFRKSVSPEFMLGILNSKLVRCVQRHCYHEKAAKGAGRLSAAVVSSLRIPQVDNDVETALADFVREIISAKEQDYSVNTKDIECEIDQRVCELYGLTRQQAATLDV
jgi:hypothetical protein